MKFRLMVHLSVILLYSLIGFFSPMPLYADSKALLSNGQTLYVPVYSHIYTGNTERPFLLTVTLSVRNIDPVNQIEVTAVDFYQTQREIVKNFIKKPKIIKPLESLRIIIPENAKSGSGANFIVQWKSDKIVNPPIVESIMIGAKGSQGISFTSRGRVIIQSGK